MEFIHDALMVLFGSQVHSRSLRERKRASK